MIRQELVAKDLIQKGERHKMIVRNVLIMREGPLQTFNPMHEKSKTEKLEDQIPQSRTFTSPYYGLA